MTAEDVGNMHFGFVGKTLFAGWQLTTGAGIYQIISWKKVQWKWWRSHFDDPNDTKWIKYGIARYKKWRK